MQEVKVGRLGDGPQPAERARQLHMMCDYLLSHVRDRRTNDRGDLISRLVAVEQDGHRITDDQAVNFSAFLLLAGHLTTTLLLGNALLCLQEEPEAMERLRGDRSLIPVAVEETLRHRPPVVFQYRLTKEDTEVGGVPVPAGRIVVGGCCRTTRRGTFSRTGPVPAGSRYRSPPDFLPRHPLLPRGATGPDGGGDPVREVDGALRFHRVRRADPPAPSRRLRGQVAPVASGTLNGSTRTGEE